MEPTALAGRKEETKAVDDSILYCRGCFLCCDEKKCPQLRKLYREKRKQFLHPESGCKNLE